MLAACHSRFWHSPPVRCTAAFPSGYRVTFTVPAVQSARLLVPLQRSAARNTARGLKDDEYHSDMLGPNICSPPERSRGSSPMR